MAKLQAKAVRTAAAAAHVTQGRFQSTPTVPPPPEVPSMKQFFGFVFVLKQKVPAAFWRGEKGRFWVQALRKFREHSWHQNQTLFQTTPT